MFGSINRGRRKEPPFVRTGPAQRTLGPAGRSAASPLGDRNPVRPRVPNGCDCSSRPGHEQSLAPGRMQRLPRTPGKSSLTPDQQRPGAQPRCRRIIGCCRMFAARGRPISKESAGSAAAASMSWVFERSVGPRGLCPFVQIVPGGSAILRPPGRIRSKESSNRPVTPLFLEIIS